MVSGGVSHIDNHSVLTVQSLLDSQVIAPHEAVVTTEDDVFQCGKCKKQFTAIDIFMSHKKECCNTICNEGTNSTLHSSAAAVSQNTLLVRKIQVSSPLPAYAQSVVFTEADLLSLAAAGLDQNVATTMTSSANLQSISPSCSLAQSITNSQTLTATIQQVIPQMSTVSPIVHGDQHPNSIEVPFLNNKLVSGPLLLMSQPVNNSTISGVVLNIGNSSIATSSSERPILAKPDKAVTIETLEGEDEQQNDVDREPSTVNIITEFHSSMVKTKKRGADSENEDDANKKGNKLNCAYCWKSFTKNFDLQQHIRCHTGEKPFQCIVCGRAFAQKSNVKKHMQTHKVWPDGLARTLPQLFNKNQSSGEEDGDYPSEVVNEPTSDHHSRNQENRLCGKNINCEELTENSYACPYCAYVGKTYYKLKSHMKQHETKKVYKCILSTCGLMFTDLDPFLEHTKSHENEMTYRCHECSKNFRSLYDLGAHQYTHSLYPNQRSRTTRRFFRCSLCLNKYSTPAALNHHVATSSHVYACTLCEKVFPCERYLRRHLRIHSGSESFVCNLCGKGFKTENYLKVHMLTHSENKPFECSMCKAAFNRKDKLKRHLLIHEPNKRFKCPFRSHSGCPKEFNRPDKLKAHILTHSCIKPFICRICGRNFTRRAHLRDHVRLHDQKGNISQGCKQCGEKFEDPKDAKDHECSDVSALKKPKDYKRNYRPGRQRKHKNLTLLNSRNENSGVRRRIQRKKQAKLTDKSNVTINQDSEVVDDIPTAHIEIISTNGELVASGNITHISLPSNFNYESVQSCFEHAVAEVVGNNQTIESSDSSNLAVTTLHLTDSNSALCNALCEASIINTPCS